MLLHKKTKPLGFCLFFRLTQGHNATHIAKMGWHRCTPPNSMESTAAYHHSDGKTCSTHLEKTVYLWSFFSHNSVLKISQHVAFLDFRIIQFYPYKTTLSSLRQQYYSTTEALEIVNFSFFIKYLKLFSNNYIVQCLSMVHISLLELQ